VSTFRFRAQRVLELRQQEADLARAAVQRAREQERACEAALASAEAQRDRFRDEYAMAIRGATRVAAIAQHRLWMERMDAAVRECLDLLQRRRGDTQVAVEALAAAVRRVRVLERLRERLWRRHVEAERLAETRTLDEIATLAYARRGEGDSARGY
jgi:flagellar export protein FliJ